MPLLEPESVTADSLLAALPGTSLVAAVLAAHEWGHIWVRTEVLLPKHSYASDQVECLRAVISACVPFIMPMFSVLFSCD